LRSYEKLAQPLSGLCLGLVLRTISAEVAVMPFSLLLRRVVIYTVKQPFCIS
jgi:hypothetical protein